ncbi:MAG: acyl-CoA synthetase FdrA [Anaerolineales bacterium]|nr:acyl-CoA synthetase FdrA [Anaerolineales bacterium]MCW5856266.1 acyl-CoA synthetase FdrA [Anaerolineales bacterium]
MSVTKSEIRSGAYYDSVVLMQLQRNLLQLPGVEDAGVVMATPANLELLAESQLLQAEGKAAKPEDLLIVVKAASGAKAQDALAQVDELLKRRSGAATSSFRPRSLAGAVKALPDADWVSISVPGRYAAGVAREALEFGKHVFLYSDNVSVEDEIGLKQQAQQNGLLLMGPDCGTAIINGIGLGFANHVRQGSIGLVAASGTGLQSVTSAIHNLGGGVSQAIGTGGRDLKEAIGAASTLQGLAYLAADPDTRVIVIISKPPDAAVAGKLLAAALGAGKPVVVCFLGFAAPAVRLNNLHFASGLEHAARIAVDLSQQPARDSGSPSKAKPISGYLRGLFSGGTLASELFLGLNLFLSPLFSNVAIRSEQKVNDAHKSQAHTILDLGEDEFTVGRLHPMMDNDLRIRRLKQEAADPEVGLILLDVVLGEGAHPNPAAELAPAIAAARKARKELEFVALLVGTDEDPQDIQKQEEALAKAGATVYRDITQTLEHVVGRLLGAAEVQKSPAPFAQPLAVINIGVEGFYDSQSAQGAQTIHVEWRPPASGDEDLMALLSKMRT